MALPSPAGGRSIALLALSLFAACLRAEPLSRKTEINFFGDVSSRDLQGLASRSDGRLVSGPVLNELKGEAPADLLWSLEPAGTPGKWFVGTGPDGRIMEISIDPRALRYTTREIVKLDESHVFALKRLPDGTLLAGTSPRGALCLIRDGKVLARVALPVDSLFDILLLDERTALVSTGNPARIYRVDLPRFAVSGTIVERITDPAVLASHGLFVFAEVRDRNLRSLARFSDGRIVAGSAPRGNIYVFPAAGGAPQILQENRDAEVTDLLTTPAGDLYAAITFSAQSGESRITPPNKPEKDQTDVLFAPAPAGGDKFGGRASVIWFPPQGFPETLTSRGGAAFYKLQRERDTLLVAGGEQGELLGFDLAQRLSLTFAGSPSSQLNGLSPDSASPGRYLVLHNNAPGFALLDFSAAATRTVETRRIDLGGPARLGTVRFGRFRNVDPAQLTVEMKSSNGSDDVEGWSEWTRLRAADGGWSAPDLNGRYVRLRVSLPAAASTAQLDAAAVHFLPQNHRPQLQDFRVLSPNFAVVPPPDYTPVTSATLGQLMQPPEREDERRKASLLGSTVIPSPGSQVVFWNVSDPDGDRLATTFSLRRDGDDTWTDLAVDTTDSFVQFDTSHLSDGVYFTRLVTREIDPRPAAERLAATFETDDLIVDHAAPELIEVAAKRDGGSVVVTIRGRDALSLLDAADVTFNNGVNVQTEQPADGIRDGHEETFVFEIPLARVANATSVEVTLYDAAGNSASRRLPLKL